MDQTIDQLNSLQSYSVLFNLFMFVRSYLVHFALYSVYSGLFGSNQSTLVYFNTIQTILSSLVLFGPFCRVNYQVSVLWFFFLFLDDLCSRI